MVLQLGKGIILLRLSVRKMNLVGSTSVCAIRTFNSGTKAFEWRQRELQKLEERFENEALKSRTATAKTEPLTQVVDDDDSLQEMWRQMEGRVTRRRPRTVEETGGKAGRQNIKRTDEEVWQREGLYDIGNNDK
jgi:hypothetical protein